MLETELQFFAKNREDLLRRFPGKFVVIKGRVDSWTVRVYSGRPRWWCERIWDDLILGSSHGSGS